jgi:hypothetical protein
MGGVEDDFRGTVPTSDNILGESFLNLLFFVASCKSEITNLELTTFVEKDIAGLQVSVDDVGRVKVVAATQELVHKVLHVLVGKLLSRVNDSMHVSLHQLGDNVNIFIASRGWGLQHIN